MKQRRCEMSVREAIRLHGRISFIFSTLWKENGSPSRIRTYDQVINSHLLYR